MKKISIEDFLPIRENRVISKALDLSDRHPVLMSLPKNEEIGLEAYEEKMTYILITGRIALKLEGEEVYEMDPLEGVTIPAHTLVGVRCLEDARFLMMEK